MARDKVELRAIRAAIRNRGGELRDDACERLRHAARRHAKRAFDREARA